MFGYFLIIFAPLTSTLINSLLCYEYRNTFTYHYFIEGESLRSVTLPSSVTGFYQNFTFNKLNNSATCWGVYRSNSSLLVENSNTLVRFLMFYQPYMYNCKTNDAMIRFFINLSINLENNPNCLNSSQYLYILKFTEFALQSFTDSNNVIPMTKYFAQFQICLNYLGDVSFNVNDIELFRGCRINLHSNMDFHRMNEEIVFTKPNKNQF